MLQQMSYSKICPFKSQQNLASQTVTAYK